MPVEKIYYSTPLGTLLIQTENEAVGVVSFVNSWRGIKAEEKEIEFKKPVQTITKICVQQLDEYFSGTRKNFELDIQQQGTPFQQTVWAELCNINYGKTISYLDLSKRIGNVKAIRAVGTANGTNHVAIIVPCHRVIGANGSLVGYGGDLWRKKWLLEHEAKFASGVQKLF